MSTATPQESFSLSSRNASSMFSSQSIEFVKYPTIRKSDGIVCNCTTGSASQSSQISFVIGFQVGASEKRFALEG